MGSCISLIGLKRLAKSIYEILHPILTNWFMVFQSWGKIVSIYFSKIGQNVKVVFKTYNYKVFTKGLNNQSQCCDNSTAINVLRFSFDNLIICGFPVAMLLQQKENNLNYEKGFIGLYIYTSGM